MISGRLGVRIGFDEYELGPGMAVSFESSAPHRLWAIGDQPAEAIWVVVGRASASREELRSSRGLRASELVWASAAGASGS